MRAPDRGALGGPRLEPKNSVRHALGRVASWPELPELRAAISRPAAHEAG